MSSPDPLSPLPDPELLLAVDIGNTTTGMALFAKGEIRGKKQYPSTPGIGRRIEGILKKYRPTVMVVSSVVPALDREVGTAGERAGLRPLFIDHRLKTDLKLKIDHPRELGADRIANTHGGLEFFHPPLMVIDSGTATTFDLVNRRREYIGGVIFPGIEISLRSLADHTAKLKKIRFSIPRSPVGSNSADCIRAGLYHGYIGSLNHLILLYKELLGSETRVIVTGGLVKILEGTLRGVDRYDENLIFRGIRAVYRKAVDRGRSP